MDVVCGFGAFLILPGYYPTVFARGFGPFVDLLLTRGEERKKPHHLAGRMSLILLLETGCGGTQPTILAIGRAANPEARCIA